MLCPYKLSFKHKSNCEQSLTYKNIRNRIEMSNSEKYLKSKSKQTRKAWKKNIKGDNEH